MAPTKIDPSIVSRFRPQWPADSTDGHEMTVPERYQWIRSVLRDLEELIDETIGPVGADGGASNGGLPLEGDSAVALGDYGLIRVNMRDEAPGASLHVVESQRVDDVIFGPEVVAVLTDRRILESGGSPMISRQGAWTDVGDPMGIGRLPHKEDRGGDAPAESIRVVGTSRRPTGLGSSTGEEFYFDWPWSERRGYNMFYWVIMPPVSVLLVTIMIGVVSNLRRTTG